LAWLEALKELADRLLSDIQALEREQSELEILIRQTHSEMERASPQEASAQRRLREVEANLQAYGPAELRSAYATARELELKLFVLRTQLDALGRKKEELVARQRALGEMHTKLSRALLDAEAAVRATGTSVSHQAYTDMLSHFDQQLSYLSQVMMEGPAQSLVNASIAMEILRRVSGSAPERIGDELSRLGHTIEQTLQQIKYVVYVAGPPSISDLGLAGSLKRLAKLLASYGGFKLEMVVQGTERHGPDEWTASVYRLVTGMLLLPLRHRAAGGHLVLTYSDALLEIALTAAVEAPDGTDRALLQSLRARSEALGGGFTIVPPEGGIEKLLAQLSVPQGP
jgi:two-component system sensor histidine kinase DegS